MLGLGLGLGSGLGLELGLTYPRQVANNIWCYFTAAFHYRFTLVIKLCRVYVLQFYQLAMSSESEKYLKSCCSSEHFHILSKTIYPKLLTEKGNLVINIEGVDNVMTMVEDLLSDLILFTGLYYYVSLREKSKVCSFIMVIVM